MRDPADEYRRVRSNVPERVIRTARAVRADLRWLHGAWMGLVFPDGPRDDYPMLARRRPGTRRGAVAYRLWAAVGVFALVFVYPLFVLGIAVRYYARRIDQLTAALGFAGVALVSLVVWGAFTVATFVSAIGFEGFLAVGAAGGVATVAAVLALYATRRGDRRSTVALGYPLGVTALFLPPVVAALYSPTLASVVFPHSESLAVWLLDNVLAFGGLAAFIRGSFDLEGPAYVGMWVAIAVPTGWLLGALVTLVGDARGSPAVDKEAEFYR